MKKYFSTFLLIISLLIIISFIGLQITFAKEKVIYYGSNPDSVRKIQQRLKNWGYYYGGVDGIFGYKTELGVKRFQRKHGLTQDGICGPKTLEKMGLSSLVAQSKTKSTGGKANRDEAYLLAQCINGEARGEPYIGQVAVAGVIMNRVRNGSFPNTISGVIYQPGAFDAVADGQIYLKPSDNSIKAANDALAGWDPSGGAIYYYNPVTATNKWILSRPIITQIGKHVFCK